MNVDKDNRPTYDELEHSGEVVEGKRTAITYTETSDRGKVPVRSAAYVVDFEEGTTTTVLKPDRKRE
jgi:hypothetical protein